MWSISKQAYPYRDTYERVKHLYKSFGAKRLMWGTDWPICLKQLSYRKAVDLFRNYLDFIPGESRADSLQDSPERIAL